MASCMLSAEFSRDRLRTVLPRLQARHQEVVAQEYLSTWQHGFSILRAKRDELSEELSQVYPEAVNGLADILTRIAANNVCARGFRQLIDKHGIEFINAANAKLIADSEAMARARLRSLPDGVWRAVGCARRPSENDSAATPFSGAGGGQTL